MDNTVVYSEVKLNDTKGGTAPGVKILRNSKSGTQLKCQSFSKLTLILGFAVLLLLMIVVGMSIEVVRLHKDHSYAGSTSQARQNVYNRTSSKHLDQTIPTNPPQHCGYCPKGWLLHKEMCYLLSSVLQNSTSAAASCSTTCSQLARAEDFETLAFLRKHMTTAFYWVGLNKTLNGSIWLWTGSTMLSRTHYFNNSNHFGKDCAMISKLLIYAESCNSTRGHICEKEASCGT
ncbi:CD209 antigen-like protein C isoform X2 [Arapaima gigas]